MSATMMLSTSMRMVVPWSCQLPPMLAIGTAGALTIDFFLLRSDRNVGGARFLAVRDQLRKGAVGHRAVEAKDHERVLSFFLQNFGQPRNQLVRLDRVGVDGDASVGA